MRKIEVPVLVVGGGPTGLSAALFLGRHAIETLIVTRAPWTADTPRAHITNQRTMEIMRDVGLEQECYRQSSPHHFMANKIWATSLAGEELGRIAAWGNHPARKSDYEMSSPSSMCDLPQTLFEPILLNEASNVGAKIRFQQEFLDLSQDQDGVTTIVRDHVLGEDYEVSSKYLIAGDGARSRITEKLGLPMTGTAGMGTAINVVFDADLTQYVAHRPGTLYTIYQPGREGWSGSGVLRMVRPWNQWVAQFPEVAVGRADVDLTSEEAREILRSMIGDPAVPVTIRGINKWFINSVIADRYSNGRVFCAGDAVHRHPPMLGLGSNTCVADTYNLCWKLAFVMKGYAGEALLDTYSEERQPIGKRVVDIAIASFKEGAHLAGTLGLKPGMTAEQRAHALGMLKAATPEGSRVRKAWSEAIDTKHHTYNANGVQLNQIYHSAAVIADEISDPDLNLDFDLYYWPTSQPGARLPHCWLAKAGRKISTLDLAGHQRFALITGIGGDRWRAAAQQAREQLGIELEVEEVGIGLPVSDTFGDWARVRGVEESGCVLVRPDMHIGWRCLGATDNCSVELLGALRAILARR